MRLRWAPPVFPVLLMRVGGADYWRAGRGNLQRRAHRWWPGTWAVRWWHHAASALQAPHPAQRRTRPGTQAASRETVRCSAIMPWSSGMPRGVKASSSRATAWRATVRAAPSARRRGTCWCPAVTPHCSCCAPWASRAAAEGQRSGRASAHSARYDARLRARLPTTAAVLLTRGWCGATCRPSGAAGGVAAAAIGDARRRGRPVPGPRGGTGHRRRRAAGEPSRPLLYPDSTYLRHTHTHTHGTPLHTTAHHRQRLQLY
jgi:hypothetical protein